MITNNDIDNLKEIFVTKEDLQSAIDSLLRAMTEILETNLSAMESRLSDKIERFSGDTRHRLNDHEVRLIHLENPKKSSSN